jgi:hypothetical protein
MLQQELLAEVLDVLHQQQIEYMITGSLVSSLQGEPRTTHDIDIVVNIRPTQITSFIAAFSGERFYIDEDAVYEALKHHGMFNLIDTKSGDKVDFWIVTNSLFDISRFSRRILITALNLSMYISTPEDTIIMKLNWSKLSGKSRKQMDDALRVYELQFKILNMDYIQTWVQELELIEEWNFIITYADPIY